MNHPTQLSDHDQQRLKRLKFRAWHRGTREADYMMGGFFDHYSAGWHSAEIDWFEALLEYDDVYILDWVLGKAAVPEAFAGELMAKMQRLDFIEISGTELKGWLKRKEQQ